MTPLSRDRDPGGIVPDTKDWTWVLQRPCPACGFSAASVQRMLMGQRLNENTRAWVVALDRLGPEHARRRPNASTWSPVEYACHVRDVYRLFGDRLALMLEQDDPEFANWDQDATAVESDYGSQHPATVAMELAEAGSRAAEAFLAVPSGAWTRPGRRSDGSTFTVDSLGRYLLHDVEHHLHDVTR